MRPSLRLLVAASATCAVLGAPASPAPARLAADDVSVVVCLGTAAGGCRIGAVTTDPTFKVGVEIGSQSGVRQNVTLTIGLPAGLHWGTDLPDPSEGCAGTEPAVCRQALEPNEVGTVGGGWGWDVVAERSGIFEITAVVSPSEPDPNLANNNHTLKIEVEPASAGGPGATRVTASAVVLTPSTPRAGKVFTASVNVRAGGTAVRPSSVACAGTVGPRKTAGKPSAASGRASCRYVPPASAKGQTLRGSVSFTARGQRFTKRFAAKLR